MPGDRRKRSFVPSVLVAVAAVAGCAAHVSQPLIVDGEPFTPARCHSGQPLRIDGVVLVNPTGRRLLLSVGAVPPKRRARRAALPAPASGTPGIVVFSSERGAGDPVGRCGTMTLRHDSGTKLARQSVSGTAELSCSSDEHTVVGTVAFDNCH